MPIVISRKTKDERSNLDLARKYSKEQFSQLFGENAQGFDAV
jgi:hypothetical protein